MKKLLGFVKDNRLELLAFIAVAVLFYVQMVNSGVATHDELSNLYNVRTGTFFEHLMWNRWGLTVMGALPSYIHALCESQVMYRLLTMLGLLVSCGAFAWFLSKVFGKKFYWIALILFFGFAQIQLDHDGLIAFSFSYQLNACYAFFGLGLFWEYLHNNKRKYMVFSAIFYLLASISYEAFVLYAILFLLMDLWFRKQQKQLHIKTVIKDLWLHAVLVFAYLVSYFYMSRFSSAAVYNGEIMVKSGFSPREVAVSVWKLLKGLFPLNYRYFSYRELLRQSVELTVENICRWILIIFLIVVIAKVMKRVAAISWKKYLLFTGFCALAAVLSVVLPSLSEVYINWLCYEGMKSYGISYYAYFFIIAWISATLVVLYQHLPVKKLVLGVLLVGTALVIQFTLLSNKPYIEILHRNQVRYDLWDDLTQTAYFRELPVDAQIYTPDYIGVHQNISTLGEYANVREGMQVTTYNNAEMLDYSKPVYVVNVDVENECAYISPLAEDGVTDEIFLYGLHNIENPGILADRVDDLPAAPFLIDGYEMGKFASEILIPQTYLYRQQCLLECPGMYAGSVELFKPASLYSTVQK